MLTKILWIIAILTITVQASTERNAHGKKEYIRCFDGQVSYIKQKDNLFYSSQNNKFLTKENASKDSCKKQYIINKKGAIVCTRKKDVLKTIQNIQKTKQVLYPSCLVLKEELHLVVSSHALNHREPSYYHIKYQGHNLFIPKFFMSIKSKKNSQRPKKRHKKHHRISKYKTHKTHSHQQNKKKRTKRKKIKHYKYSKHIRSSGYQHRKSKRKPIPNAHKSYTYKCVGSHGNINISATDDNSISMASDILWRMCQNLKTEDEVCKIRDCYKLIQ